MQCRRASPGPPHSNLWPWGLGTTSSLAAGVKSLSVPSAELIKRGADGKYQPCRRIPAFWLQSTYRGDVFRIIPVIEGTWYFSA